LILVDAIYIPTSKGFRRSGIFKMVKLTEVEDEHFTEKPATTKDDALLASDDDDDYTDTGTTYGLPEPPIFE
jgi:hypothetical protein